MIKFICIFNNLLYLIFQLKKYLWNYFSTGFWSIFPYQVKVSRQKAYLKGKHGLFCNNFLSHLYMCTASSCLLRLQKVSFVHLKPETQGWFLKLQLYILYFWFEKIFLIEEDSLILKDFYLIIYCHIKKFSLRFVLGFRTALFEEWEKA